MRTCPYGGNSERDLHPRIDEACTRDFGLIVTDGCSFFSEEKRHALSTHEPVADGVPAFAIVSRCADDRYRIDKLVLTDPRRDVVLQRVEFRALRGALADYHPYALLAPHLVNRGAGNTAWLDDYKGTPMLFAEGRVFDMPPHTRRRYQVDGVRARHCVWRYNQKCRSVAVGHTLRVEVLAPAMIHWSSDAWRSAHDTPTRNSGLGVHFADLDTSGLAVGTEVVFTLHWLTADRWEGTDYRLVIVEPS